MSIIGTFAILVVHFMSQLLITGNNHGKQIFWIDLELNLSKLI